MFIKFLCRDPNRDEEESIGEDSGRYWPAHTAASAHFLRLEAGNLSVGSGLRTAECHFWAEYLPSLIRKCEFCQHTRFYDSLHSTIFSGAAIL